MPNHNRIKRQQRRATQMFLATLVVIAVALGILYTVISVKLEQLRTSATLVTAGTDQVITTERIALLSQRLPNAEAGEPTLDVLVQLDSAIARAWAAHGRILSQRRKMSAALQRLYFEDDPGIDSTMRSYLRTADLIVRNRTATSEQLDQIATLERGLIKALERSVQRQRSDDEARISQTLYVNVWVFSLSVALLVALAVFILRPILRQQSELMDESRHANDELAAEREVSARQREFVSLVSHEFRTPMTVIRGRAEQLVRKSEKLNTQEVAERGLLIRRSVDRLVLLIESVLSSARLEADVVSTQMRPVHIETLVRDAFQANVESFPDHRLMMDVEPGMGTISCDEALVYQALTNLIANACKYSGPGTKVAVKAARIGGGSQILMEVSDSGVGIPQDEVPRLFERFYRASTSGGFPGSGIGLHLVKRIVEIHDGDVSVTSTVGQGSTFRIVLPVAADISNDAA